VKEHIPRAEQKTLFELPKIDGWIEMAARTSDETRHFRPNPTSQKKILKSISD
jgi:hypothetical protein